MKNYNIIVKSKNEEKSFSQNKVMKFMRDELGYSFSNVRGSDNAFWINGKYIENAFNEFISGSKYYKLVVNASDFGISASGDFNAFNLAGIIRDEMKEAINGQS